MNISSEFDCITFAIVGLVGLAVGAVTVLICRGIVNLQARQQREWFDKKYGKVKK